MGIEYNAAQFIKSASADFSRTLMIGRQMVVTSNRNLRKLGLPPCAAEYAEPLFRTLGAKQVDSLDASPYEGANIIHDLNEPISGPSRYTTIVDCGTLEHVFNFPVAIKNLMDLLEVGGTLLLQTPCNNYAGHGLYQFSPELFHRVLAKPNGFQIKRIFLVKHLYEYHFFKSRWIPMDDPAGTRRSFVTKHPALLLIEAVKTASVEKLSILQSDYELGEWKQPPAKLKINETLNRIYDLPLALVDKIWRTKYL